MSSSSLKGINGNQISPDGRYVAYRVRETNWEDNLYVSQLWIVNISTGESFQLTRREKIHRWIPLVARWKVDRVHHRA